MESQKKKREKSTFRDLEMNQFNKVFTFFAET